jgi:hypothetical protein
MMDALQVIEELSEQGRLPVGAIRAARAGRDTMVPRRSGLRRESAPWRA